MSLRTRLISSPISSADLLALALGLLAIFFLAYQSYWEAVESKLVSSIVVGLISGITLVITVCLNIRESQNITQAQLIYFYIEYLIEKEEAIKTEKIKEDKSKIDKDMLNELKNISDSLSNIQTTNVRVYKKNRVENKYKSINKKSSQ